jgi:hypothetical protein
MALPRPYPGFAPGMPGASGVPVGEHPMQLVSPRPARSARGDALTQRFGVREFAQEGVATA